MGLDMRSPLTIAKYARTDRHVIENIRDRADSPDDNYIECDCGWRGAPADFVLHRRDVLKAQREAALVA